MNIVDLFDIEKHYAALELLSGISLTVGKGQKVGLIGRNGCGKSTLLKIIAGLEDADSGTINYARGAKVEYLAQEADFDCSLTVDELLRQPLAEVYARQKRFAQISHELAQVSGHELDKLLQEQQELQNWLDMNHAWEVEHRIENLCHRLGIDGLGDSSAETLSGGQQKRLALARVLLACPDMLLLDEPTNHLDAQTVQWLEEELRDFPGALVLVTHDRYFLDRVVERMFELEAGCLQTYTGNYTRYLEQKQEQLEQEQTQQSRLLNVLRREEAWLKRGAKARTTKQKARKGRVDDLRGQVREPRRRDLNLEFESQEAAGGTILELKDLAMKFEGKQLVEHLSFIMRAGQRVGILGPNGCGKSTLIKTILSQWQPAAGDVVLGNKTRIGYIDQERSGLDPDLTVSEVLGPGEWVHVSGKKRHKIGYLEDFLFSPPEQRKLVSVLSGGERARLLLAMLMLEGANLLILDEPTNDLDIPTLQVLEQALLDYSGCVLLVTHDRYLLDRVATAILSFEQGAVVEYAGNFSDMQAQQRIMRELKESAEHGKGNSAGAQADENRGGNDSRANAGKSRRLSYKEKRELAALEEQIELLEQELAGLEQLLSNTGTTENIDIAKAGQDFADIEAKLEQCYERWEELENKNNG